MRVHLQGSNDLTSWTTVKTMTFNGPGIDFGESPHAPVALTDTMEVEYPVDPEGMFASLIRLLPPPLIKKFPKKENAEQKKRKCGKVFLCFGTVLGLKNY